MASQRAPSTEKQSDPELLRLWTALAKKKGEQLLALSAKCTSLEHALEEQRKSSEAETMKLIQKNARLFRRADELSTHYRQMLDENRELRLANTQITQELATAQEHLLQLKDALEAYEQREAAHLSAHAPSAPSSSASTAHDSPDEQHAEPDELAALEMAAPPSGPPIVSFEQLGPPRRIFARRRSAFSTELRTVEEVSEPAMSEPTPSPPAPPSASGHEADEREAPASAPRAPLSAPRRASCGGGGARDQGAFITPRQMPLARASSRGAPLSTSRPKRTNAASSFKEPSLNSKLRKGDAHTFTTDARAHAAGAADARTPAGGAIDAATPVQHPANAAKIKAKMRQLRLLDSTPEAGAPSSRTTPRQTPRRSATPRAFAEPSLRSKLRQGDENTFGRDNLWHKAATGKAKASARARRR